VGVSGTFQSDTKTLGTPALIKERDKPITPSPEMRPRPVSQALNTTNSAFSCKSKISEAVNKPSSLPDEVKAIARGKDEDYLAHHPYPEDIFLVIEISDSTLDYDQTKKLEIPASA
jgi:hypothetical protein